jgi:tetratricopeptide (TPR) repeat protein
MNNPPDPRIYEYNSIGDEYFKAEKYEEALEAYMQALQIDPENHNALRGKVRALLKLERYKEVNETYNILQPKRIVGVIVPYSW